MQIVHNLILDMDKAQQSSIKSMITSLDTVHVLHVQLVKDGIPFDLSKTSQVLINLIRSDGQAIKANQATIEGDTIIYSLTASDLGVNGPIMAQFILFFTDGKRLSSPIVQWMVQRDISEGAIEIADHENYTILTNLIKQVSGLTNIDWSTINLDIATAEKDGLMSAIDKQALDKAITDIEAFNIAIEQINQQIINSQKSVETISDEQSSIKINLNALESSLTELTQTHNAVLNKIIELDEIDSSLQETLINIQNDFNTIGMQIQELTGSIEAKEQELSILNTRLEENTNVAEGLSGNIVTINTQIQELISSIEAKEQELSNLNASLGENIHITEGLINDINNNQILINNLTKSIEDINALITPIQNDIVTLQTFKKTTEERLSRTETIIETLSAAPINPAIGRIWLLIN